ncbi:MAG: fimbria/pilus outer membrane usher protein [Ramlibacter sp.]
MRQAPGRGRHHLLAALLAACCAAGGAWAQAPLAAGPPGTGAVPAGAQPVVVPLTANGTPREPVTVLVDGERLWMAGDDLLAAGMLPEHLPRERVRNARGRGWLDLAASADLLSYRFDLAELTLQVDLAPRVMALNAVDLRPRGPAPATGRPSSAYLNYSFTGGSATSPALFLEGVASVRGHTFVGYLTRDAAGRTFRGPVTLMLNDERRLRQVLVGDSVWPGGGLLGAVPIGGVTWQSYFGFEPGFIATPTLDMRGVATTPSTVDILVNGSLVGRQQIPAGPFALGNIVAQAGSNNVTAVVRDAFGRETRIDTSGFYGSPLLLQPGLSTFAVSAGRVREDRFGAAPAYGDAAVLAQASLGITPNLTAGAAVQATADARVVAAEVATTSRFGEIGAQVAHGQGQGSSGMALALSYRLGTVDWSISAAMTRRQRGFRELAAFSSFDHVLRSDEFSIGRNLLGVDWSLRWAARDTAGGDHMRRLALAASRRWTPWLSTTLELARTEGTLQDNSVFLLASILFDPVHSAYVGVARAGGQTTATLDVVRSRQQALSTGYRLSTGWSPLGGDRQLLQVGRDTSFGDYEVQVSRDGGGVHHGWRASGSVLGVGGRYALAPPVNDAFALVHVPDSPDVPVKLEGRLAGLTRADGTLVVTGLSSYSGQRIGIDADALPLDFEVGSVEQRISAPLRGGQLVEFEAKRYRASAGRLLDPQGGPVGSAVMELADGRRVATGTAGDFVFEGEPPRGRAKVVRAGGAGPCSVEFPPAAAPSAAAVQRLGELRCIP